MKCSEVQAALAEYSVDALSVAKAQHVRRHLHNCSECRVEWQLLITSIRLLDSVAMQDPPRDLWPGITLQLQQRSEPAPSWWDALRSMLTPRRVLAATVAASAMLFAYAWKGRATPEPQWVIETEPMVASSSSYMRGYFLSSGDQPFLDPIARGLQASMSERMVRSGSGRE